MLSLPGVVAAERPLKQDRSHLIKNIMTKFISFLPFLNQNTKGDTSSDETSNDDSGKKIKIAGMLKKSLVSKDD